MLNANPRNFLLSTLPEVLHHADDCIRHVYFPTDAIVSMMHGSEARSSTAAGPHPRPRSTRARTSGLRVLSM